MSGTRKKFAGTWRVGDEDPRCSWRLAEGPYVRGGRVRRTRTGFSQLVQSTWEP
jgi:hypothetical protein